MKLPTEKHACFAGALGKTEQYIYNVIDSRFSFCLSLEPGYDLQGI